MQLESLVYKLKEWPLESFQNCNARFRTNMEQYMSVFSVLVSKVTKCKGEQAPIQALLKCESYIQA